MSPNPQNEASPRTIEQVYRPVTRRTFLKGAAASLVGVAGLMAALRPLLELEGGAISLDELLQKHYRELKPEHLKRILETLPKSIPFELAPASPEPARPPSGGASPRPLRRRCYTGSAVVVLTSSITA